MTNNFRPSSSFGCLLLFLVAAIATTTSDATSSCECIRVNSWHALKATVDAAISVARVAGTRPHVLFCPFHITKPHTESYTDDQWESLLELDSPIHLQCYKNDPDDSCTVQSSGPQCTRKMYWCRHAISVEANDVWLQGFTMTGGQNGAVTIASGNSGVKLIDMEFIGNSSPEERPGSVVSAEEDTSVEVFESRFIENTGTALQNWGHMLVIGSQFENNVATAFWMSPDADIQGGGVGGACINSEGGMMFLSKNKFIGNEADSSAPAVWSYDPSGIDGGGNCGRDNRVTGISRNYDGIHYRSSESFVSFGGGTC